MSTKLQETLLKASAIGRNGVLQAFQEQGHHLTGQGEASFEDEIVISGDEVILVAQALKYMITQNYGFTAADMGGRWQGAVTPLKAWFMSRGMDEKTALKLAVITAKKQAASGMPLEGAAAYSSTGERLNYITIGLEQNKQQMDEAMIVGIGEYLVDLQNEYKND